MKELTAPGMLKRHKVDWWWRRLEIEKWPRRDFVPSSSEIWFKGMELAVYGEKTMWQYELFQRVTGHHYFKVPWINLKETQKREWKALCPPPAKQREHGLPMFEFIGKPDGGVWSTHFEPGKGGWSYPLHAAFDLRASDSLIIERFSRWLSKQRKELGIEAKKNKGFSKRVFPWRVIELIDLQQLEQKLLSDAERSHISKAKKELSKHFSSILTPLIIDS